MICRGRVYTAGNSVWLEYYTLVLQTPVNVGYVYQFVQHMYRSQDT